MCSPVLHDERLSVYIPPQYGLNYAEDEVDINEVAFLRVLLDFRQAPNTNEKSVCVEIFSHKEI